MEYTITINGHQCRFQITCLKYSRPLQSWVFFAKGFRRQEFPITEPDAEILLRQRTFTRHDHGDKILFQMNRNGIYSPPSVLPDDFNLKKLL